jgi:hypothetical protein
MLELQDPLHTDILKKILLVTWIIMKTGVVTYHK